MPKFLVEVDYSVEGHKALLQDSPSARKTAVANAIKKLGGKLEAMYFCLGEHDAIVIADIPDHLTAAALNANVCASGMARTMTTLLLTPGEADEALAKQVVYRAPGA